MDLKEIAIISAIVLLSSGIFTGLFLTGMPAVAIFFGLVGVPAVFIGYTWYRVKDTKGSMSALGEIQGSKLERLLEALKDLWNQLVRLQERYFWPLEETRAEVEGFARDLAPYAQVRIENGQLFYEVDHEEAPSATWTEERQRELSALEEDLAEGFATHLADWTTNLEEELERLADVGALEPMATTQPSPLETPTSLSEVEVHYRGYLEEAEEKLISWHEETGETLRSVEQTQGINVEAIWDDHEMVGDALDRRDLPFAAALLRKVLLGMDEHLAGEFTDEKSGLQDAIGRVRDLKLGDIVGHETWRQIEDLHQRVRELQSSAQLLEISELETRFREAVEEIEGGVINDLQEATSVLTGRSLPAELIDDRDEGELIEDLPELHDDLYRMIPRWTTTMEQLARVIRRRSKLAEAIKLYPRVEPDIQEALTTEGEVTTADLKVKDADPFFRIYAAKFPEDCELDVDEGILRATGAGVEP